MDSKYLDWVENAAVENLRLHHHTADVLAKEAVTTLTVLLAGMGGGIAYSTKLIEQGDLSYMGWSMVFITVFLTLLSFHLVWTCMRIQPIPSIHNEPANLIHPTLALDEVRRYELDNMQVRIKEAVSRNERTAISLTRIRMAAVLGPSLILSIAAISFLVAA